MVRLQRRRNKASSYAARQSPRKDRKRQVYDSRWKAFLSNTTSIRPIAETSESSNSSASMLCTICSNIYHALATEQGYLHHASCTPLLQSAGTCESCLLIWKTQWKFYGGDLSFGCDIGPWETQIVARVLFIAYAMARTSVGITRRDNPLSGRRRFCGVFLLLLRKGTCVVKPEEFARS